ncbi:MAG: TIGR03086 family protein [Chloroflexi bacterium]|nr:TIGR03086 family protein [Chloroflexota bacterium]
MADDPRKLWEKAAKEARKYVSKVKDSDMAKPTPCSEWKVQQLVDHIQGSAAYCHQVLTGNQFAPPAAAKKTVEKLDAAIKADKAAMKAPGILEKKVKGPMGEMPGDAFIRMHMMDMLLHSWDLGTALGQKVKMDKKVAQTAYDFTKGIAEGARQAKVFGPAVPEPANADIQQKLLCLTGRKP